MKSLLLRFPHTTRFTLAIILGVFALILSGFLDNSFLKTYFPFVAVVLLIIVTWFMYKTEDKSLKEIGLNITKRNLSFLLFGLFIGIIAFIIAKLLRGIYTGEELNLNESINYSVLLIGLYTVLPSVMIEELLYRGYCFKKTIEISNVMIANILFSTLFMLIHVFDSNVINNIGKIVFFAVTIPIGHLLFATALLKSKTLFFPIGLHWGNNWASFYVITENAGQNSIFHISNSATFETWSAFIIFLLIWNGFYLLLTYLIWKWDKILRKQ